MKTMLRWMACAVAAVLLTLSAALALFALTTTAEWAERALVSPSLQERQQKRIDEDAQTLAERWQVSMETLSPCVQGAAEAYSLCLADWWGALWSDQEADWYLPVSLTDERALIAEVMADERFAAAHDRTMLRAIARDEVAYGLDETVCSAVLPLRRSVTELALSMAAQRVSLPEMRLLALKGAGVLAALALLLMALNRKAAGVTLMTAGGLMALLSVPVWLLDLHRMLRELNSIAAAMGDSFLLWLAIPWYGAALLLVLLGGVIIRIRNGRL